MTHTQDEGAHAPNFAPVALRARHDGWTPTKQISFLQMLADTGCVTEAAKAVGMSVASAYALRRRPEATSFREAWDVALQYGVSRLADAALGRAINGVAQPVFYKGEQVGERRTYDEKLTMFLLRYRRPDRYGVWLDGMEARLGHPDAPAIMLHQAIANVAEDAQAEAAGLPPPEREPLRTVVREEEVVQAEHARVDALRAAEAARKEEERRAAKVEYDAFMERFDREREEKRAMRERGEAGAPSVSTFGAGDHG